MKIFFYSFLFAFTIAGCSNSANQSTNIKNRDSIVVDTNETRIEENVNTISKPDTLLIDKQSDIDDLGFDKVLKFEKKGLQELLYITLHKKSLDFKLTFKSDSTNFELNGKARLLNTGQESISDENNHLIDVAEYVYDKNGCELIFRVEELNASAASVFPRACTTNNFDMLKYDRVLKIVSK